MKETEISPELKKLLLIYQRNEITEYEIYKRLARKIKDENNRQVLERIARE